MRYLFVCNCFVGRASCWVSGTADGKTFESSWRQNNCILMQKGNVICEEVLKNRLWPVGSTLTSLSGVVRLYDRFTPIGPCLPSHDLAVMWATRSLRSCHILRHETLCVALPDLCMLAHSSSLAYSPVTVMTTLLLCKQKNLECADFTEVDNR